jgi:4-hydroxy-tetrahydrodipicolinate synthase
MLIQHISPCRAAFSGIWVPLVTPFDNDELDLNALQALANDLIVKGVHGLVVCGTTGEAAHLDQLEQMRVLSAVLETAGARCPVMMGVGGSDTRTVASKIKQFDRTGVAGFLVSAPSYVRPSQQGILAHFDAVAAATQHPIVLYNIPARSGVNMELATVAALAERPQFAAIKEAGGNLHQLTDFINQTPLSVLCGDDTLLFAALCAGGHGAISAAAHIRPDLYVQLFDLIRDQQLNRARALFRYLLPMIRLLFSEPNPAPLKAVLAMQGKLREELRLPMTPVSQACRGQLATALEHIMAIPLHAVALASPALVSPALASPSPQCRLVEQR